jgi:membrane associated rhomboid family serine protease
LWAWPDAGILVTVSSPELSVVCKSCGSEVSPYVTECPYCGHRLRKRAPQLEREGDEIKVREGRRERRKRLKRERQLARAAEPERRKRRRFAPLGELEFGVLPVATIGVLFASAVLIVVQRAVPWNAFEVGAIAGPVGGEFWRYFAAPFVYEDVGAFLITGGAILIFGSAVERRIGSVATLTLIIICGTGSLLIADGLAGLGLDDFFVAAGGNGVALGLLAAWLMLWRGEAETAFTEPLDVIGVTAIAVVLLLLPLVEITADPIAGLAGGALGLLLGWLAARRLVARPG